MVVLNITLQIKLRYIKKRTSLIKKICILSSQKEKEVGFINTTSTAKTAVISLFFLVYSFKDNL